MKKRNVELWTRGSAEYVVSHALWQKSRRRNPSEPFLNETSPKKALKLAESLARLPTRMPVGPITLTFSPGTCIGSAAKEMVATSKRYNGLKVKTDFNGIGLTAFSNTDPEGIVNYFREKSKREARDYLNSPKGIQKEVEWKKKIANKQARANALLEELPHLNFKDFGVLLDWLCELQDPSDCIQVDVRREEVVGVFKDNGFEPDVNCGEQFQKEEKENVARYLIGQAMKGLISHGQIHHLIHSFTLDWKKKFTTSACN